MGIKMSPKQFPSGYTKYEEAEVDRLVAIFQINNSGGGGVGGGRGPCGIQ